MALHVQMSKRSPRLAYLHTSIALYLHFNTLHIATANAATSCMLVQEQKKKSGGGRRRQRPVNAVDRGALVVATQHEKILGILDLVGKEEADALKTLGSAIYIVAEE